ncbi:MAG: 1,4-alpha-glucan branching protein [Bacteroidetes bacterium]|nr:1,4-alpha-glucan branching protein [Bacteroidota bacterium]
MSQFLAPSFLQKSNIYEINIRQYSAEGTFNAFAEHLPRLRSMGIEILWLMPVHPIGRINRKGSLGSYYSISDHKGINPEFGNEQDFKSLIQKAHNLGFKVILDWVANHCSWDHVWTKSNPDFFLQKDGNFVSPFDWHDVIQLNHSNLAQQEEMKNCMAYWIREFDIDGFRADLAHLTPLLFWIDARKRFDKLKPGLIWLAESEDINYCEAFDITFTWRWMHLTEEVIKEKGSVDVLRQFLENENFPGLRLYFTSNHDENSWNGTEYDKYNGFAKALAVFSFLYPGSIPLIYSGQESANKKMLDFFDKDEINWNGFLLDSFYKELFEIRKCIGSTELKFLNLDGLLAWETKEMKVLINLSFEIKNYGTNSILPGEWLAIK